MHIQVLVFQRLHLSGRTELNDNDVVSDDLSAIFSRFSSELEL